MLLNIPSLKTKLEKAIEFHNWSEQKKKLSVKMIPIVKFRVTMFMDWDRIGWRLVPKKGFKSKFDSFKLIQMTIFYENNNNNLFFKFNYRIYNYLCKLFLLIINSKIIESD